MIKGHCAAVEWGSDRCETTISAKSRSFGRLVGNPAQGVNGGKMTHSLRSVGSAALNFAMVAQGGLDLYWLVSLPDLSFVLIICKGKSDAGHGMCPLEL